MSRPGYAEGVGYRTERVSEGTNGQGGFTEKGCGGAPLALEAPPPLLLTFSWG